MITEAVLVPAAFDQVPNDEASRALYFNWCTHLLYDLLQSGIVLVDSDGILQSRLLEVLARWPQQPRKRAQTCVTEMRKRGRFSTTFPDAANFGKGACGICSALAINVPSVALLAPGKCTCDQGERCPSRRSDSVSIYGPRLLEYIGNRQSQLTFLHRHFETSRIEFESRVLARPLSYTRTVTLIDKQIAKSVIQNKTVGPGFVRGVEWILGLFLQQSQSPLLFEVVSQVHTRHREVILGAAERFRDYLQDIAISAGKQPCKIRVIVKDYERNSKRFDHDRYLITDQFGFLFTRGFDLLDESKSLVADGAVVLMPYAARKEVISHFASLPEARSVVRLS